MGISTNIRLSRVARQLAEYVRKYAERETNKPKAYAWDFLLWRQSITYVYEKIIWSVCRSLSQPTSQFNYLSWNSVCLLLHIQLYNPINIRFFTPSNLARVLSLPLCNRRCITSHALVPRNHFRYRLKGTKRHRMVFWTYQKVICRMSV